MAAEGQRAPLVREQTSAPSAIEARDPIIHDVAGAIDEVTAKVERLGALVGANNDDLEDVALISDERLYHIWLRGIVALNMLDEVHLLLLCITEKAYADSRSVAA